jgi:inhibitor of cysteine peptidase
LLEHSACRVRLSYIKNICEVLNMKKMLTVFLALALLLSTAACGMAAVLPESAAGTIPRIAHKEREQTKTAADYTAVYEALQSIYAERNIWEKGMFTTDAAAEADSAADAPAASPSSGASDDFSGTNIQVAGVDEGDVVKTDGTYIYILRDMELFIVKADGGGSKKLSATTVGTPWKEGDTGGEEKYPCELYIWGDRLAVLSTYYAWSSYELVGGSWYYDDSSRTCLDIYDISDPTAPRLLHELGQDGGYLTSRMIDGNVYLLSNYYVYDEMDEDKPETFVPALYRDGAADLVSADCIAILPEISSTSYTVVSVCDLEQGTIGANQTLLGGGSTVYMNHDNLYIARSMYDDGASEPYRKGVYTVVDYRSQSNTEISRLALSGGSVELAATGTVPGYLESQFSMDEYDGYLRLVTTVNVSEYSVYTDEEMGFTNYKWGEDRQTNSLYVLDLDMNMTGSVEELAPDERVYSARFDGDIGYFVTFRETDPLFAVDLSTPTSPKVLSALKIPGFSEYLHVYGQGRLFGLGMAADEETGWTEGMKLSMFDTTDPANVTEKHTLKLNSDYSEALYNHKAILVAPDKDIIGFPADESYDIYGYSDARGFYERASIDSSGWGWNMRGLYAGDYAYIVTDSAVTVLDLTALEAITQLAL